MRKTWRILSILILVFVLFGCFIWQPGPMAADDPGSKISSDLIKAIAGRSGQGQHLSHGQLQEPAPDPFNVSVFIYANSKPDTAQAADMASLGVTAYIDSWIPPVGMHPQGFITALVPISKINDLAAKNYVVRLDSAEGQSYRMNDAAATDIKASTFYSGGYTGAGVRVAILDNGLDTTHPDFPTPIYAKDYWNYPAIGDNVTSPLAGGSDHGTHVAGSALGRGTLSGGKYKGIASGAEFVFIKIGNNTTGTASNAAMSNALRDAVDLYGADIVSMSYGSWSSHHDGTDANCQAADYAVSKGATVLIAAGNEADKGKHYKGTVNAKSTTDFIQLNVSSDNCILEHNLVWYDGLGVHNELTVQYYNAAKVDIPTQNYRMEESARGTERRQFEMTDNTSVIPSGSTYYMKVTNNSAANQEFHIYYDGIPDNQVKFASPDIYYTLGSPGEADNVICVGSSNSRVSWTDFEGMDRATGETLGGVSGFSSRGPRMDAGAPQKPNLVAPGSAIISCRDSSIPFNIYTNPYTVSNSGSSGLPVNYYVMSGTSMATPIAAGSAALLMQASPGLKRNPAEVKRLLTPDNAPDSSWGYGLIDLQKTRAKAPQSASVQSSTGQGQVTFSTNAGTIGRLRATGGGSAPQGSGPYTFPFGLFSYDISDLSIGETIQVTVTLPAAGPTQWVKSTASGWQQVPIISVNGNIMVIQLTDGGIGDDDGADGDIEDPGGPVIVSSAISTTPASSSATMSVTPAAPPILLPNVTVQAARLSSTSVSAGTPVTVTADITNRSTVNGNKRVTIYVNGLAASAQTVTVNSGGSTQLNFSITRGEPGVYTVYVDGVPAGSFTVETVAGNDIILLASFALVALAFLLGIVMLWRRQAR